MTDDQIERLVSQTVRQVRNGLLDAVIGLCEAAASAGGDAELCVRMIRDFKAMLPPPPRAQQ